MANCTKHNVVFDSDPSAALCENLTSSTKPEVHNVLHRRQGRTVPRPAVTCTENVVEFGRVHHDRQTDALITIPRTPTRDEVINSGQIQDRCPRQRIMSYKTQDGWLVTLTVHAHLVTNHYGHGFGRSYRDGRRYVDE